MLEFGQILGLFSALVLAAALVAFVKLGGNPLDQHSDPSSRGGFL